MTDIRTPDDEVTKPGHFYPPFREGWTYQGATYEGHSPFSVDFNRRTTSGGWLQDEGDPVLAAADGTVAEVDKGDGLVMLNHPGGWRTEYRHMTGIPVKVGQKVQRGDRIGSIGNVAGDGRSFGAHLHHVHWRRPAAGKPFERVRMRFEGQPVTPSVGTGPASSQFVVGPPPKATWQSAFRESEKLREKAETKLAARDGRIALMTEEAQRAQARIAELEAATPPVDCSAIALERDAAIRERDAAMEAMNLETDRANDLFERIEAVKRAVGCAA